MVWPLANGALCGIYVAWQFAAPGFTTRILGIFLGVLCSLPVGAFLGIVAIFAGSSVLAFIPQNPARRRLMGWRLAFGGATGMAVALVIVAALVWIGLDGWGPSTYGAVGAIAVVAFVASCLYFPDPSCTQSA